MKLYLVFENIKHSESLVRGIFSTTDLAYDYADELEEKHGDDYTSFSVETYVLNERH